MPMVAAVLGSPANRFLPCFGIGQVYALNHQFHSAVQSAVRQGPLPQGMLMRRYTARAAAAASAGSHWRIEESSAVQDYEDHDDDDDGSAVDDDGEDETPPPPLPTNALELLSEVLTGIANIKASGRLSSTPKPNLAGGNLAGEYKPLQFCINCCRPLPDAAAFCSGCGHDPARSADVLGDPDAWVDAYAAQLQEQQQPRQQEPGVAAPAPAAPVAAAAPPESASREVLLAADPRMLLHRSSLPPYPGRPERLQAIMSRLHSRGLLARCRLLAGRPAEDSELLGVHSRELVAAVRGMGANTNSTNRGANTSSGSSSDTNTLSSKGPHPEGDERDIDSSSSSSGGGGARSSVLCADTLYNAHTCTAALLAAGAAVDVGRALAAGRVRGALAVVRPPGAQAGFDLARGGCYLNNVALAAAAALAEGVQRVLIVDWDVHHGRGTQEIFADDPRVMVLSMHRYDRDTYPGSGALEEVGEGAGEGTTVNVAFGGPGIVDGDLLSAALHVVLPLAYQFRPQLVLVAAGFGALQGDPIGGCNCSPAVFAHLTHLLSGVAPRGLGLLLEGGYDLAATAEAVEGCLRVLLGEAPPLLPGPWGTTSAGWVAIMNTMQIHSQYWSTLHPLSFNGWASAINSERRQIQEKEQQQQGSSSHDSHHHRNHHDQHSSSFGGMSAAGGGWAAVSIGEDEDDDVDSNGEGLGPDELAQVAAALRQRQRQRQRQEAADLVGRGKPEAEQLAAVE